MAMQDIGQRYTGTINYRNLVYDMSAFHIKKMLTFNSTTETEGRVGKNKVIYPTIHTYIYTYQNI